MGNILENGQIDEAERVLREALSIADELGSRDADLIRRRLKKIQTKDA